MSDDPDYDDKAEKLWHSYMALGKHETDGYAPWYYARPLRSVARRLPSEPRCRICYYPFEGLGGSLSRMAFGIERSRLNPQLCNICEQTASKYQGGTEIETTILFADVRGSTTMAEGMRPAEFVELINRYYRTATKVLFDSKAMVEKLIGDGVTAFYVPGFSGADHARDAIEAAQSILRATGHNSSDGPWIPVGIGVHTGTAYVGSITADDGVVDIGVMGDAANTASRLSSQAGIGEVVVSNATATAAGLETEGLEGRHLQLKGRSEPVDVWVIKIT